VVSGRQRSQYPLRREREGAGEIQTWWRPGGTSFMPVKEGVEVKEERSMPTWDLGGRDVRRRVVVVGIDRVVMVGVREVRLGEAEVAGGHALS
jgi:hypothetical protein